MRLTKEQQRVWKRFARNKLALVGLVILVFMLLAAVAVPLVSPYSYADQKLDFAHLPPRLTLTKSADGEQAFFVHKDVKLYTSSLDGRIEAFIEPTSINLEQYTQTLEHNGATYVLDFAPTNLEQYGVPVRLFENGTVLNDVYTKHNKRFWLGTDALGRDVLVRVMFGARISLFIAFMASIISLFIGAVYGGISGYFGGRVDSLMMRTVDIISSIPFIIYVILIMFVAGGGLASIILAMGITYWINMARIVRSQSLSLQQSAFVEAARTMGFSHGRILFKHILPNVIGPIIVTMAMMIPSAIFTEAFLSFIGLGLPAPQASWGTLINDALGGIRSYGYLLMAPSVAISLTMLAFNFVGDGLRDALDPKFRQ